MECLDAIKKALPGARESEIKAILKELDRERSAYFASREDFGSQGFRQRALDFLNQRRYESLAARKEVLFNTQKEYSLKDLISQPGFEDKPWDAIRSAMAAGEVRENKGLNSTPELMRGGLMKRWMGWLATGIKESGMEKAAQTGELDLALAREIVKPGSTGVEPAEKLAKVIKAVNNDVAKTLQLSGSAVRQLQGYITKQSHDPSRIGEAGFEQWASDILQGIGSNVEKVFNTVEPQELKARLKDDYDAIVSGEWSRPQIDYSQSSYNTVGGLTRNLDRKTSRSRTYQFESPEKWVEYNQQYGKKNITQSVVAAVQEHARNASMMQFFGTQPDQMFEKLMADTKAKYKGTDIGNELEAKESGLRNTWATLRGVSDMPGKGSVAKGAQWFRNLQSMSKLGSSLLTALPADIVTAAGRMQTSTGKGLLESLAETVSAYAKEFSSPSEQTQALQGLHRMTQQFSGSLLDGANEGPGAMSRMAQMLWKINGMDRHTAVMHSIAANAVQEHLASFAQLDHGALPEQTRAEMARYGIEEPEWRILQRALETHEDGTKVLTPEAVRNVPLELAENVALKSGKLFGDTRFYNAQVEKFRFDTEVKFLTMLQDQASIASTTPGVRQKAYLLQGTTADSGLGILLRLATQFKQVPLMVFNETMRQVQSAGGLSSLSGNVALAQRVGMLMAAGYISNTAKDLAMGKTPADPKDPKTAMAAFVNGGAGGLWGDAILGAYDRDAGRAFANMTLGPTFGQGYDAFKIYTDGLKGKMDAGKALNLAMSNLPFQNLYYTKGALNYFVLNGIHEAVHPGYLANQENRTRQTPGALEPRQDYLFYRPTQSDRTVGGLFR